MAEYDELGMAYRAALEALNSLSLYLKDRVPLGVKGARYSPRETIEGIERGEIPAVPPEILERELPSLARRTRKVDPLPIQLVPPKDGE